jgi:thiamine phosphate synthase YjbQ (UPF0047 family)
LRYLENAGEPGDIEIESGVTAMRSYRKELWFDVRKRREFINITPEVEECVRESGIKEGFLLCNAMHITASVFINDEELK